MFRKKKRKLWQPVVTGFVVLYLISMELATCLMAMKFQSEFKDNAAARLSSIQNQVENDWEYDESLKDIPKEYFSYMASQLASTEAAQRFQQFSVAFYQTDGQLLAKAEERIGTTYMTEESGTQYNSHVLDKLTQEEKAKLAKYGQQSSSANLSDYPPIYQVVMREWKDSKELCQILVQELTWEQTDSAQSGQYSDPIINSEQFYETETGTEYYETDSKIVWERNYPDADEKNWEENQVETQEVSVLFPYLTFGGAKQWLSWSKKEFLQNFDSKISLSEDDIERLVTKFSQDSYEIQTEDRLYTRLWADVNDDFQPICYMELRFESHPLLAAMDYLKYEYLAGLVLMVLCIAKVLYAANKTNKERVALEEMRRDFTNAMAHELKTPLGIIRGFAENLQEHHMENKRDYYLAQIIRQTEEMDRLVMEMIAVSKMDSEQLILQKEPVSMYQIIREQMERLEPMIQEKQLQIQYTCREDFIVTGDSSYLEKAVWNLLSNAVDYNVPDGNIQIQINAKKCSIENTGNPLTASQLAHVFDMFYSGDESRNSKDKHMGMGLFLAKKILNLHGLKITLENTRTGIQVILEKQN